MIRDISNMFYFILQGYLQGYQIVWLYVYCYYLESSEICFNFRVFYIHFMCRTFSSCKKVSPQWEMDPVGIEPTSSRAIVPKHLTLEHGSERTPPRTHNYVLIKVDYIFLTIICHHNVYRFNIYNFTSISPLVILFNFIMNDITMTFHFFFDDFCFGEKCCFNLKMFSYIFPV